MPVRAAVLLVAAAAASCAGALPCAAGRVCGAASWMPQNGVFVEGAATTAPAVQSARAGEAPGRATDALRIGLRPVLLRFDLAALAGRGAVERAVLALAPHPSWRPMDAPVRLFVRTVDGTWTAVSVAETGPPSLGVDPIADVVITGGARRPLRLDVTAAVRAWLGGALPPGGLALECSADGVVVAGVGAPDAADRPRLEVVQHEGATP